MTREEKNQVIAEINDNIARAKSLFFTDFAGLTVEQSTKLRREFSKQNVGYQVAKNTLITRALASHGADYAAVSDKIVGMTAIAYGFDDPLAPAKILKKFVDDIEKPTLKFAYVEGQTFDGKQLKVLASMPSRLEMIASIMGSIQAPASGIVGAINAVMRDLVGVIDAIEKQKQSAA